MAAVEWPEIDPATVAPLRDERPHMYAHMPSRFVTLPEAKARHWKYFYIGDVCKKGHKAPRFVSNPSACVDCDRVRSGMQTIGGKGAVEAHVPIRSPKTNADGGKTERTPEPTKRQKDFLAAYAELKDFDSAAKKVNVAPAVIEGELSWSLVFRDAYDALEERTGLRHIVAYDEDYEWDEDKRSMLIRMYIDTGDLGTARDAVRCTPSQYHEEVKNNPEFAGRIAEAKQYADQIVVETARRMGLAGNPQIIGNIAKNLEPDTTDDPGAGKTREQLIDEIARTIGLAKQRAAGRVAIEPDHGGVVPAVPESPPDVSTGESESYSDLL